MAVSQFFISWLKVQAGAFGRTVFTSPKFILNIIEPGAHRLNFRAEFLPNSSIKVPAALSATFLR